MELVGQVAVVTGAASGIGQAIALRLAAEGAAVVIGDLNEEGARDVVARIEADRGRVTALRTDITSKEDADALVQRAVDEYGRLDILVNNAGFCRVQRFMDATAADFESLWRVHALGTFLCSQAAAHEMIRRGYGRIVNVASGGDRAEGSPFTTAYQSAKSAQKSLGAGMAAALAEHGITVNSIAPALVVTPLWDELDADYQKTFGRSSKEEIERRNAIAPQQRQTTAEDIADLVLFLVKPQTSQITGETVCIY